MYDDKVELKTIKQLSRMTRIADFYCALPVLSRALYKSFHETDGLLTLPTSGYANICEQQVEAVKLAKTLRNGVLFRDALILLVSQWTEVASRLKKEIYDTDRALYIAINTARMRVAEQVARASFELQLACHRSEDIQKTMSQAKEVHFDTLSCSCHINSACYFRHLLKTTSADDLCEDGFSALAFAVTELLACHLVLRGEPDENIQSFLCGGVDDDELPWDVNEKEW